MQNTKKQSYIYEGKEFYLTGRIATSPTVSRNVTMVEIHPITEPMDSTTYDKWVKKNDLLLVRNMNEEE